jgi:hypothetical protein
MAHQPSRLAVQLHNRKHSVPGGVYVLIAAIILLGLVVVWHHNQEPSEESKRQHEESERLHRDLEKLDRQIKQP